LNKLSALMNCVRLNPAKKAGLANLWESRVNAAGWKAHIPREPA